MSADGDSYPAVRFSVLGKLRAWRGNALGETELVLSSGQQNVVLALLLVHAGQPVSRTELIQALWPHNPPATATNALHRHIGHIRRLIGSENVLVRRPDGYQLRAGPRELDLIRFRLLVDHARQSDPESAVDQFLAALDLWHGRCAEGTAASPVFTAVDQEYIAAVRQAAEIAVRIGAAARVIPALRRAVQWHPLDETAATHLVAALSAEGRYAEAATVFETISRRLSDELGIDPGDGLRAAVEAATRPPNRVGGAPAQLPAALPHFAGRHDELEHARQHLRPRTTGSPAVIAIDGMPGVGKTTFAIALARAVAHRFPDGQLYADLRGYHEGEAERDLGEVLEGFLTALGVPQRDIPPTRFGRIGLYRTVLRDRRVLVLLDNARRADQVRDLLPVSVDSAAIVTSRAALATGGTSMTLEVMSAEAARATLIERIAPFRPVPRRELLDELADLCGRLPLALALVAARMVTFADVDPASVVEELRLSNMAGEARDIHAVFSSSYRLLPAETATTFRLFSLLPATDTGVGAVASLIGADPLIARRVLGDLADASLLAEHSPGRYRMHDLLRRFAQERSRENDDDGVRDDARSRLLDYFRQTAHRANLQLLPQTTAVPPGPVKPAVTPEPIAGRTQALRWFADEQEALAMLIRHVALNGPPSTACTLAMSIQQFYQWRGQWQAWADIVLTVLAATPRATDTIGAAYMSRSLAGAYYFLDRLDDATTQLGRAGRLFDSLGRTGDGARVQHNLGVVLEKQGRYFDALPHQQAARERFRKLGLRKGEASAIVHIARCYNGLGDALLGERLGREAMDLYESIGDVNGVGVCWATLAGSLLLSGRHRAAIVCVRRAITRYRTVGNLANIGFAMLLAGDIWLAAGRTDRAHEAWREIVESLDALPETVREQAGQRLAATSDRLVGSGR